MSENDVKKQFITTVLMLVIMSVFASATCAVSDVNRSIKYDMEGRIELEKQSGHEYGTGARMRQAITAEGSIRKKPDILMEEGYIRVDDRQDWVTDEEIRRNLAVTSSIKLSTPPAYV